LLHVLPTTFSLAQWTRALSHGGYPLRHTVVDSTMGQIRVKAVLTAIHAIEGPPIFLRTSYGGLGEAQEEGYERSELLINKDKRIKRTFFIENRFISKA
jgi:hypothetical protein